MNTAGSIGLMLVDRVFRMVDCFRVILRVQRRGRGPDHSCTNEELTRFFATNLSARRSDFINIEDVQETADFYSCALKTGMSVPSEATVRSVSTGTSSRWRRRTALPFCRAASS